MTPGQKRRMPGGSNSRCTRWSRNAHVGCSREKTGGNAAARNKTEVEVRVVAGAVVDFAGVLRGNTLSDACVSDIHSLSWRRSGVSSSRGKQRPPLWPSIGPPRGMQSMDPLPGLCTLRFVTLRRIKKVGGVRKRSIGFWRANLLNFFLSEKNPRSLIVAYLIYFSQSSNPDRAAWHILRRRRFESLWL